MEKNTSGRSNDTAEKVLSALQTVSKLAADVAGDTALPGLSIALSSLAEILTKIQTMKSNVEGVDTLLVRVVALSDKVRDFDERRRDRPLHNDVRARVENLAATWSGIAERANQLKSRSWLRRFFCGDHDAKTLATLVQEINDSIQDGFVLTSLLNVEEHVHCIHEDTALVIQDTRAIQESLLKVKEDVKEDIEGLREDIKTNKTDLGDSFLAPYAKKAQHDATGVRRSCLEGTRVNVLERLRTWIVAACTQTDTILRAGNVFWISGLAGTGKTTIAFSLVQECKDRGILGADFFCSRSDADCSNPSLIFPTISRQLCHFHPPYKEKVAAVLRKDPDIVHAGLSRQFEELIVKPLIELKDSFPKAVIVIDALDECQDQEATSAVLSVIAHFIHLIVDLVSFVVTSRPERHITVLFEAAEADTPTLKPVTTPLLLHKIELESASNDIRRFLKDGFARISQVYAVDKDWPSPRDVDKLVELSNGLFIWAATVLLFIKDKNFSDPQGQLQSLITMQSDAQRNGIMLDSLYTQIAQAAYAKVSPHLASRVLPILGTIALAREPLSTTALASLVGLPENSVINALLGLRSVLHIPENPHEAIHVIHPTFPEYLLAPDIEKPEAFRIIAADHHTALLSRSLVIMQDLKQNIAGITSHSRFKTEVHGLSRILEERIPTVLSYTCRHWSAHMSGCIESALVDKSFDVLHDFLHHLVLRWLEACSLIGAFDDAVHALHTVSQCCQELKGRFVGLVPLLIDCHRFALTYSACVDAAPLQLYHSALALAPAESLAKKAFMGAANGSLVVRRGAPTNWAPCLDKFPGHDNIAVFSVKISPDGSHFVTGGGNFHAKIWKIATRTTILSFTKHTDVVNCVAYSPDGKYIASASDDRTIYIWTTSGEVVYALKGHTDPVYSVAYSMDGSRVLSATVRGEVKLWDTRDGRCILSLAATTNAKLTWQVAISSDGGIIARGEGSSLCLYDTSSAQVHALNFPGPDEVQASTFSESPDGGYVAARTARAIRVWCLADQSQLVRHIDVPDTLFSRLAFSRDGTYIACGSESGSVLIWRVASKDPPYTLHGHTKLICDITWSPDRSHMVSVAEDGDVRVWDITQPPVRVNPHTSPTPYPSTGFPRFVLVCHKGTVALLHTPTTSIDISQFAPSSMPEDAPAVSLFVDMVDACDAALRFTRYLSRSVRESRWAFISGYQHVILDPSTPTTISTDGSLMAYLSSTSDEVIHVCNLRTGRVIATLVGHADRVYSLALSPDGKRLATGSKDYVAKVWDVTTGSLLYSHKEHQGVVRAMAFSSDGRLVASGAEDKTVRILDLATSRITRVLETHRDWNILHAIFTADDTHIVALDDSGWVDVWEVATGIRIHKVSIDDDSWIHPFHPSLDNPPPGDDGATLPARDFGQPPLALWNRANSVWPLYEVTSKGWVYGRSLGRDVRLCWLPPEWREVFSLDNARFCAIDHERRTAVEIDVSSISEYGQTWAPKLT